MRVLVSERRRRLSDGQRGHQSVLDYLVTSQLIDRLLAPERLETLLAALFVRRAERAAAVDERIAGLQARADEADEKLRRLYKLIEDGVTGPDGLFADCITVLKT